MNDEMSFEIMLRQFLGEKAKYTAGQIHNPSLRKKHLLQVMKVILKKVDGIDTSTHHKQMLMDNVENLISEVKSLKDEVSWGLVLKLLSFSSYLLGFDYLRGGVYYNIFYHRDKDQYYTTKIFAGGDVMQDYYDKKDVVSARRKILTNLKNEGYDDFKSALIMNLTEYQVKKLRKNL